MNGKILKLHCEDKDIYINPALLTSLQQVDKDEVLISLGNDHITVNGDVEDIARKIEEALCR